MASKLLENTKAKFPKSPRRLAKSPRSASPNSVLINGYIVDKESSENIVLPKRMLLDNIVEESDLTEIVSLEDTVKKADENVQKFIQEMSCNKAIEENDKYFKVVCESSQEELKGLTNFLSTIDNRSKNKIVDTLINVYKTEILTGLKQATNPEPQDKISKFKTVCKGLIGEHYKKSEATVQENEATSSNYIAPNMVQSSETSSTQLELRNSNPKAQGDGKKPLNLSRNFLVNYQTKQQLSGDSLEQTTKETPDYSLITLSESNNELLELPSYMETSSKFENPFRTDVFNKMRPDLTKNTKNVYADLPPVEIRLSKEQAIDRILGRKPRGPIAQSEYLVRNLSKEQDIQKSPKSGTYYEHTNRLSENPFFYVKRYVSEGIQATLPKKSRKNSSKNHNMSVLKSYKYRHESSYESQSDIAINCPFGCQLKLKKSKSDTDIPEMKMSRKKQRKRDKRRHNLLTQGRKTSLIPVAKKSSTELLKAQEIRRKQKLISYLDKNLKTGDSEFQFSQILFEKPNIDNDLSYLEIPVVDTEQAYNFNANYLLHSLRIHRPEKTDIVPKTPLEYFNRSPSEMTITEEDYRTWLRKRNWGKYSNIAHEFKSMEQLRSISEKVTPVSTREICGEYGYYLDRGDFPSQPSTATHASTVFFEFGEAFLYEHVVISTAINFFLTFNAQRTRTLNRWDRCVQVFFFGMFYLIWFYFGKYVFVEPTSKILWR